MKTGTHILSRFLRGSLVTPEESVPNAEDNLLAFCLKIGNLIPQKNAKVFPAD
jgi:hypothetical protein